MKHNMVGWFEIPVTDMDRAKKFYETVFNVKISIHDMGGLVMGWFPNAEDANSFGSSGSLVKHKDFYKPSKDGVLIYFSSGDVDNELGKIEKSGGTILHKKTLISDEIGYMAVFIDTEGNRIALHSKN
ncbi:VOC family protein [Namhaeicola litoreus]|uniref:VOC family protein n=1 Tax=Namhaeicola litoreus TaxID=1052145 RepID=A0ABW3Y2F4_9FLAO